jgi:hypothetical protein
MAKGSVIKLEENYCMETIDMWPETDNYK